MKIFVLASDKLYWALPGMMHQWQKYCGLPITIAGFTPVRVEGAEFVSLGDFADFPANRWTNAVLRLLELYPQEQRFLFMLEDYWLTRQANLKAIQIGDAFMQRNPEFLRFDLTTDRMNCGTPRGAGAFDWGSIDTVDIIEGLDDEYRVSMQAGIWNREPLLKILKPNETPWQFELDGSNRAKNLSLRVFGTRQWPLCYNIMVVGGKLRKDGSWMYPARDFPDNDWEELKMKGLITDELCTS